MSNVRKFADAVKEHGATHQRMVLTMQECFPTGTALYYKHGRRWVSALVIGNDNHSRLKVRGKTGKEYWIHATSTLD